MILVMQPEVLISQKFQLCLQKHSTKNPKIEKVIQSSECVLVIINNMVIISKNMESETVQLVRTGNN